MYCDGCKKELLDKDFIKNQLQCYRCTYKEKCKLIKEKKCKCRQCEKVFIVEIATSKKPRTVYCSLECAKIGHKVQTSTHWTKVLRSNCLLVQP